ncbi:D-alanyl-D-alanine carboxypeptidase family protein [Derxia gummosa]|uniref:serine-type D-Ala-D-Ala carboxypeptidase n=1 Tax=Derxia gummosa DSM 723 TaxID=1121388 RepID=A0A8B6X2D4_9BURK|nr:D-alanyl-D-alanine carboxypeptidase family protein [Derxia gummosa]
MHHRFTARLRAVALATAAALIAAAAPAAAQVPPPVVAARSWLVLDVNSAQILAMNEADTRTDPASLTKLMTAYLVFNAIKAGSLHLTDMVLISERAWKSGGNKESSRMFVEVGKQVSVDDLLHGMIIQSGNDATIALAERVGGTEEQFADLMNRKAAEFGMKNSHFSNSHGLSDPNHYSTARDLAILAQRLVTDFPEYLSYYSTKEYTYNGIKQENRNRLLWLDPSVDGLKTGYTDLAGWCLIATARRPFPAAPAAGAAPADGQPQAGTPDGNRRIISVVVGAQNAAGRVQESQKLLNYAFQSYDDVRLYAKGATVQTIPVFKGTADTVTAGVARELVVSVPRGQGEKIKAAVERSERLIAPIQAGQQVGTIKLTLDGKPVGEVPLVALGSVNKAGFIGSTIDAVRMMFK